MYSVIRTLVITAIVVVGLVMPGTVFAQTGQLSIVNGRIDFGGAAHTSTIQVGTSLPATCTVGELYFKSDATAGQNIYECQSTNTWTQSGGTGGTCAGLAGDVTGTCGANSVVSITGGALASLPTSCTARQVYYATDAPAGQNYYGCAGGNFVPVSAPSASPGYQPNQLLGGCGVEYTSGLSFTVGACSYTVAGSTYTSPATGKTLSAADPTNPRIDVIGVCGGTDVTNCSGGPNTVFVATGTPAASPSAPTIDPTTELALTFVTVAANASTPSGVTSTLLYDEGTGAGGGEWTATCSANLNCTSTNNPYHLTHDIEATAAVLNNNFTLVKPSAGTVDLGTFNNLVFYLRSKAQWATGKSGANAARSLTLTWLNGSTQKGNTVVIQDGSFGFQSSITTGYQQISIPTSLFGIAGVVVTTLKANVSGPSGSASIGFYVDEVTLQGGSSVITLPTTLMNFKGTWSSAVSYQPNDTVVTGGLGYIALLANTNVAVTTATTWAPLTGNASITGTQLAVVQTRRTVCNVIGANNAGSALADADLGPQSRQYFVPAAATVVEVEVAGDGGTPNIIIGRSRAGSIVNLTSAALATASAGGIACSNTGGTTGIDGATTCSNTLQNTGLNAGDWFTLVSGTAGGVAKEMTACVTFTIN